MIAIDEGLHGSREAIKILAIMPGIQQRIQSDAAASRQPLHVSVLALYLLEKVFWGEFSPQQGQKLADLACVDIAKAGGEELPDLHSLASVGS